MKLLGKLNDAIDFCEDEVIVELDLKLSYSELNYIRRLVLTDEYGASLAVDNLKRARQIFK